MLLIIRVTDNPQIMSSNKCKFPGVKQKYMTTTDFCIYSPHSGASTRMEGPAHRGVHSVLELGVLQLGPRG